MANVDMCEHDWPGSGCKKCKEEIRKEELYELVTDPMDILHRMAPVLRQAIVPPELQEEADLLLEAFKAYLEDDF